ncbi:MBL fold metallo-hydrolase [Candidatus Uhrbacteria bacterium]|nr:MBL fold metallo-hydrolase [Candidatus Uhrbacteria bacterium]
MTIQYHGDACIRVSGKIGPREYTVLLDPYDAKATGLKPLRPSSVNLVATTTGALPEFGAGPFRVTGPGEYEVHGVAVAGIAVGNRTVYRLDAEELTIAHLGNLEKPLDEAALDQLGDVDALIIPIGGKGVLTAKQASELIEQIEPKIVIPIQYKLAGAKLPYDGPEAFCKEMGCSAKAAEEKVKLTEKDLPEEGVEVKMMAVS